ncbi:MAG: hypothetical protein LBI18_01465 [Planctomycetaceae bacterium]|jgi:hypothetical protein|nr:hypothetical protein [Planctomycetaceae bacterium]
MKTNKKFLAMICFLFLSFSMTMPISSQMPISHPSRSDEIQDLGELAYYFRWMEYQIHTERPSKNALPPERTICGRYGSFHCSYRRIDNEDRYFLSASFPRAINCPGSFRPFLTFLENKDYQIKYIAIRKNTIFPLFGSLYCLDKAGQSLPEVPSIVVSAFRISDSDIPKGLTLQRRSIVFPICEDVKNLQYGGNACLYEGSVYIVGYGQSPNPSEGPRVKMVNSLLSLEEQKQAYEKRISDYEKRRPEMEKLFKKLNLPTDYKIEPWSDSLASKGVKEGWYKIGDIVPFETVAHKIINIVLPDQEDCRIIHRRNPDDKSITELKCRLIGWVELDPNPISLTQNIIFSLPIPESETPIGFLIELFPSYDPNIFRNLWKSTSQEEIDNIFKILSKLQEQLSSFKEPNIKKQNYPQFYKIQESYEFIWDILFLIYRKHPTDTMKKSLLEQWTNTIKTDGVHFIGLLKSFKIEEINVPKENFLHVKERSWQIIEHSDNLLLLYLFCSTLLSIGNDDDVNKLGLLQKRFDLNTPSGYRACDIVNDARNTLSYRLAPERGIPSKTGIAPITLKEFELLGPIVSLDEKTFKEREEAKRLRMIQEERIIKNEQK